MYINSLLCVLCLIIQAGISRTENAAGHRTSQAQPAYNFHNKPEQLTAVKGIINIDDEAPQNNLMNRRRAAEKRGRRERVIDRSDQVEGSGGSKDDTESGGSGLGPDDEDGEGESGSGVYVSVSSFSRSGQSGERGYYSNLDDDEQGRDLDLDLDPVDPEPVNNVSENVTGRELTKCEKLSRNAKNFDRGLIGAFFPVCKSNGDFKEEQCDTVRGVCWCVDRHGIEVKYTKKNLPAKPNCERDGVETSYQTSERDTKKKDTETTPEPEKPAEGAGTPKSEPEAEDAQKGYEAEKDKKAGKDDGTDLMTSNKGQAAASTALMASPGILAGIIGGTIVGLLCAILLVLFIVYRMRKKDEGSYALDEPKHSPSMHSYQRAPAREFYA
ncbi:syndecan-1-like isoform X10 [Lineus longissimus]|uniref:syndecan-1-like isoform X10 n=1 Tax=Lineus longissimus TaxID=88925 RepID=UPI00315D261F